MNELKSIRYRRTVFDGTRRDAVFSRINFHYQSGMAFEESGETEAAVDAYAAAIQIGEQSRFDMWHAFRHAYERIIALLRRTPDVVTLERYAHAYIAHPVDESTRTRINNIIQSI